jgi:hypothetical protein
MEKKRVKKTRNERVTIECLAIDGLNERSEMALGREKRGRGGG